MTRVLETLAAEHADLIKRPNRPAACNGVCLRWQYPILTRDHTPIFWRYDLNPVTNPLSMERLGINATFNSGALFWRGQYTLVVRV